jgi:hypothetical protein
MTVNPALQSVIADVDHAADIYHFFDLGGRSAGDSGHQRYRRAK